MISKHSSFTKSALKSSCLTPLPSSYISPRLKQPVPLFKSSGPDGIHVNVLRDCSDFDVICT
jgi:hypothetical protein